MNLPNFNKNEFTKFVRNEKAWYFKNKSEDNPDVVITNGLILFKDNPIIFKILDVFKVQPEAIAFKSFKVSRNKIEQVDQYPNYQYVIGDINRFNTTLEFTGLSMYKHNIHILIFTDGKKYIGIADYLFNIILGIDSSVELKIDNLEEKDSLIVISSPIAIYSQNDFIGLTMPYKLDVEDINYLRALQ